MIVIAHVVGVPVEELLPTMAGASSMLLLARGWVSLRWRGSARGALAEQGHHGGDERHPDDEGVDEDAAGEREAN